MSRACSYCGLTDHTAHCRACHRAINGTSAYCSDCDTSDDTSVDAARNPWPIKQWPDDHNSPDTWREFALDNLSQHQLDALGITDDEPVDSPDDFAMDDPTTLPQMAAYPDVGDDYV